MGKRTILVTGAAGFIGSSLADKLLDKNYRVVGVDDLNDYYDPKIKHENVKGLKRSKNFKFYKEDILNFETLSKIFFEEKPYAVIHLAARAGVRPSIDNPKLYAKVNILGTVNLLKLSVDYKIKKFIFGSSSSVYGNTSKIPFKEDDNCENIISPYGASKRSAEFFVESFHKSTGLRCTILRFFTVYGPRSRPDMAPALFSKAVFAGVTIKQFGNGTSSRDYTYIDDIVEGIERAIEKNLMLETINLGNNNPTKLSAFIKMIERITRKKAVVNVYDNQPGDVARTWANVEKAKKLLDWQPRTDLYEGLEKYIKWLQTK